MIMIMMIWGFDRCLVCVLLRSMQSVHIKANVSHPDIVRPYAVERCTSTSQLRLEKVDNPNDVSIGSAVFAQMTTEYTVQWDAPFPSKLPLPMGIWTAI